ncbi:hypothetical protein SCHPADRAFT_895599 [Schizopora paradoxa]|uniref:Uncharacterized protein n=1 Tax=Schizopora paradoxa TaxID=27342 RepID=A0A0H2R369_9AGAM|nr:hypothetical protein SCHPADRAFT_895599 [Schizopora paradoxa]
MTAPCDESRAKTFAKECVDPAILEAIKYVYPLSQEAAANPTSITADESSASGRADDRAPADFREASPDDEYPPPAADEDFNPPTFLSSRSSGRYKTNPRGPESEMDEGTMWEDLAEVRCGSKSAQQSQPPLVPELSSRPESELEVVDRRGGDGEHGEVKLKGGRMWITNYENQALLKAKQNKAMLEQFDIPATVRAVVAPSNRPVAPPPRPALQRARIMPLPRVQPERVTKSQPKSYLVPGPNDLQTPTGRIDLNDPTLPLVPFDDREEDHMDLDDDGPLPDDGSGDQSPQIPPQHASPTRDVPDTPVSVPAQSRSDVVESQISALPSVPPTSSTPSPSPAQQAPPSLCVSTRVSGAPSEEGEKLNETTPSENAPSAIPAGDVSQPIETDNGSGPGHSSQQVQASASPIVSSPPQFEHTEHAERPRSSASSPLNASQTTASILAGDPQPSTLPADDESPTLDRSKKDSDPALLPDNTPSTVCDDPTTTHPIPPLPPADDAQDLDEAALSPREKAKRLKRTAPHVGVMGRDTAPFTDITASATLQERSSNRLTVDLKTIDPLTVPASIEKHFLHLVNALSGKEENELVVDWLTFQCEYENTTAATSMNLPAAHRPKFISAWLRSKSDPSDPPQFDIKVGPLEMRKWWMKAMPDWRLAGRAIDAADAWPLSRRAPNSEPWRKARKAGPQGLVLVLFGLALWRSACTVGDSLHCEYISFLEDVAWVMSELVKDCVTFTRRERTPRVVEAEAGLVPPVNINPLNGTVPLQTSSGRESRPSAKRKQALPDAGSSRATKRGRRA